MIGIAAKKRFRLLVYLTMALLISSAGGFVEVKAAFPQVFVYPPSQTVDAIGNVFTANVCITDVFNLYAYEFKLYYNSTVLNGTSVTEGSFLKQSGQNPFFYVEAFTDHYNSTYGIVWISSALIGNVLGIDGGGVLVTIKFNANTACNSTSLSLRDVKLSDPNGNQLPYVSFDGTVTVPPKNTARAGGSSAAASWPDYMLCIVAGAIGLALIGMFLVLRRRRNSLRSLNKNGKVLSARACC